MADLQDPEKPAGYVVSVDGDGVATRNDGKLLQPAAKNPWYVLMTIEGEPKDRFDEKVIAANRRYWNGWACSGMSDAERAELAERMGLPEAELSPLSAEEEQRIEAVFAARLGDGAKRPDLNEDVDLREIHFSNTVVLEKWIFSGSADFGFSTFSGSADFGFSTFSGSADFVSSTFSGSADFGSSTFSGSAYFVSSTFSGSAYFGSSTFSGSAHFGFSTFSGRARFTEAVIEQRFDFPDCVFETPATFRGARFVRFFPTFEGTILHETTYFSAEASDWPAVGENAPKEGKEACAVIRHVVSQQSRADDAHFFFRREMAFAERAGTWGQVLPIRLFRWVSRYGYSIERPIAGLAFVIGFGWALLGSQMSDGLGPQAVAGIFEGLALSFANTFSFFGFQRLYFDVTDLQALPRWAQVLGAVQTVCGFALLFFLGLGLRNRFRLK